MGNSESSSPGPESACGGHSSDSSSLEKGDEVKENRERIPLP